MNRRELVQRMGILGVVGTLPFRVMRPDGSSAQKPEGGTSDSHLGQVSPLQPPAHGSIPVAFVISAGAVVIDFAGPWEVFENVNVPGRQEDPFRLYTVSGTTDTVHAGGGLDIKPNYTFKTAPPPKVIVIPAQNGSSEEMLEWIRNSSKTADLTMSVCTGAFVLAATGLLSGKSATTHHGAYKELAAKFPDIHVQRGARFVESGNVATAGGLSSGMDLALRVVERYFGREVATKTAFQLEYQGQGWLDANSNNVYAKAPVSTDEHPLCPVCDMEVDPKVSLTSTYHGKTYYFCMDSHKALFEASPERFLSSE